MITRELKYLAYNLLYNKPGLVTIANAPVVPIINKSQFGDFTIQNQRRSYGGLHSKDYFISII